MTVANTPENSPAGAKKPSASLAGAQGAGDGGGAGASGGGGDPSAGGNQAPGGAPPPAVPPQLPNNITLQPAPVVYNDIVDPFQKPWDLSKDGDQKKWTTAITPDKDHKRFDVCVSKSLTLMDLLADKAFLYGWDELLHVPVEGTGVIAANLTTLANGETVMDAGFTKRGSLLT